MANKFHHTNQHFGHTGKGGGYDSIRKKKSEIRDKCSLRILKLEFILLKRYFIFCQVRNYWGKKGVTKPKSSPKYRLA